MEEFGKSTWFAPAERAHMNIVLKQYAVIKETPQLIRTLNAISTAIIILNEHRQVVFANKAFLDITEAGDIHRIIGQRTGEALGCVYSGLMDGGCGTSEFCRECGAARAILASIDGNLDIQECSITRSGEFPALDLRVMASPIEQHEEDFTVFSISDIAHEKRREVLERIFLHDVKNTAGGLQGFSRLLTEVAPEELETFKQMIQNLADKLLDEIDSYNQLAQAEDNRLSVLPDAFSTIGLLNRVKMLYSNHDVAHDKRLEVDPQAEDLTIITDETILGRVVGNMTKNALEAIGPGETVTLSCIRDGSQVRISVNNPGMIPRQTQLQIFQRSFSTKGTGRGLGTYSIKLLSEQYLDGKVDFTTSETEGTTFCGTYPLTLKRT